MRTSLDVGTVVCVGNKKKSACNFLIEDIVMNDQKALDLIREVLETEIGTSANNFDWQEHWGLLDQEYVVLQRSLSRLTLEDS